MSQVENFQTVILGSGQGGKLLAWHLAQAGQRTAVVERQWVGGSCPNVACMPSKNEIWSARIAHLAGHAADFGSMNGAVKTDMAKVRRRKQEMIEREIASHLDAYKTSGAELIMGSGRFVAPRTIEVALNDGGSRVLSGGQAVIDVGTHAAIPDIPELDVLFVGEFDEEASPLGAKGLGELTAVSVAPAIANAVYHATGKRVRDLPITVEKLL